jgi:FlaA1/EpsC-like NDP-sugar epimerase
MSRPDASHWQRFLSPPDSDFANTQFSAGHAGKCVLVTGAGGSIGSSLVKALASAGVARLLSLDSSENNLFELQSSLELNFARALHEPFLGSIDDTALVDAILKGFQPDIIYHAAAWKHVPLLEMNPISAVRNNALGTYALAQTAIRNGVGKLVLISTDKAVNPHSALGVSKRLAELIVVSLSTPACRMNAIRLCNVIGSSGSVVPFFRKQISERKPLTVTGSEASRWFLTPRQAVEAILASGTCEVHGSILLPDFGEPVRIVDLAAFLVRATSNGCCPAVIITGPRPGDKPQEEIQSASERSKGTVDGPLDVVETRRLTSLELRGVIDELASRVSSHDLPGLVKALVSAVPEYVPSGHLLQQAGLLAVNP